jgi:[acyl-carrier-protein] S-malonyltransferase
MTTALLFPGQGSQKVGMGRALADAEPIARRTFEEADEALGEALSRRCWEGPEADLTLTANTQPAILATSIATLRVLEARGLRFDVAAGHSLGEWTALVAAGALGFADAIRLVRLRGQAMQRAVPEGQGAMAAVLGLELPAIEALCAAAAEGEVLAPANLNGGGQVVISGAAAAVARAVGLAKAHGAMKAVPLQVSAPFHCALMAPAAAEGEAALGPIAIGPMRVPVVANVDAAPNQDPGRVKALLVAQVTGTVRWDDSVRRLVADGATRAFEIGPGQVLRGLCKRIAKELPVASIGEPGELGQVEA